MKTDPNEACKNEKENLFWAFIHDFVSHPLMAVSGWSEWSLQFHLWTSNKAWPRKPEPHNGITLAVIPQVGTVRMELIGENLWKVWHPQVNHCYVSTAKNRIEFVAKCRAWFHELSNEFGGEFDMPLLPRPVQSIAKTI